MASSKNVLSMVTHHAAGPSCQDYYFRRIESITRTPTPDSAGYIDAGAPRLKVAGEGRIYSVSGLLTLPGRAPIV